MNAQQVAELIVYTPAYMIELIPPPSWAFIAWLVAAGIGMAAIGLIFELTKNAQGD